jgi:DNA-binding NtrC family response regulator
MKNKQLIQQYREAQREASQIINRYIEEEGLRKTYVAGMIGCSRQTLYNKLKNHHWEPEEILRIEEIFKGRVA